MSKFVMRRRDTRAEYTRDCHSGALEPYLISSAPIVVGSLFRRTSKLTGKSFVEELIAVREKPVDHQAMCDTALAHKWYDDMGVNPDYIDEALAADEKLGIKVEYHRETGAVRFPDKATRKRYCEAHGFYHRNASYGDPQKRDERERDLKGLPQFPEQEPLGNGPLFVDADGIPCIPS